MPTDGLSVSDLVSRVKAVQRQSDHSKQRWWSWCDAYGGGVRDPQKHPASFLSQFFDALEAGTIPDPEQSGWAGVPVDEKDDLIARVKRGQRTSVEFKQQWWMYCDGLGGGIRDPSRHDLTFLRRFFESYAPIATSKEAERSAAEGPGHPNADTTPIPEDPERERVLQYIRATRSHEAWEAQWRWYCVTFGSGIYDPRLHPTPFLQQFFAMICTPCDITGKAPAMPMAGQHRYNPYEAMSPYGVYPVAPSEAQGAVYGMCAGGESAGSVASPGAGSCDAQGTNA